VLLSPENVKFLGGCVDELQAVAVTLRKKTVKRYVYLSELIFFSGFLSGFCDVLRSLVPEEWMDELGDVPADRDNLGDDDNFEDAMDVSLNPIRAPAPVDSQPIAPQRAPSAAAQPVRLPQPTHAALAPPRQNLPSYFEDDDDMDEVFATMELPAAVSAASASSSAGVPSRSMQQASKTSSSSSFLKKEQVAFPLSNTVSSRMQPVASSLKPTPAPVPSALTAAKRRKIDEDPEVLDLTNVSSEALATASPEDLNKLLVPSKPKDFAAPRLANNLPMNPITPNPSLTGALRTTAASASEFSEAQQDTAHMGDDQMDIDDGIEFQIEEEPEPAAPENVPRFDFADALDDDPDALAALDAIEKAYSTTPFHYLCEILKATHSVETPYKISAFVVAAVSQLDMTGGEYRLDVDIEDGTGKCRASLHDHIMESLIGMPANDFLPVRTSLPSIGHVDDF
jgi:hypothetical protein